jgi:hypothetical protein
VHVGSRHIAVAGAVVHVYCSEACLRGIIELEAPAPIEVPRRRARWWMIAGFAIGGGLVAVKAVDRDEAAAPSVWFVPPAPLVVAAPAPPVATATTPPVAPPPQDDELLRDLMQDAWIHPLAGPKRRMPINHTAAFGAERQGQPPPECLSGHCGVDVGGAIWGEQVHAVRDGVVAWVNRGPNEEHGGLFVRWLAVQLVLSPRGHPALDRAGRPHHRGTGHRAAG